MWIQGQAVIARNFDSLALRSGLNENNFRRPYLKASNHFIHFKSLMATFFSVSGEKIKFHGSWTFFWGRGNWTELTEQSLPWCIPFRSWEFFDCDQNSTSRTLLPPHLSRFRESCLAFVNLDLYITLCIRGSSYGSDNALTRIEKGEHCSKVATMLPCPRRVSMWLTSVDADGSPSAMANMELL